MFIFVGRYVSKKAARRRAISTRSGQLMTEMVRSISDIQNRIRQGTAVVLTSQEVCDLARSGEQAKLEEVDVVTTATRAVMSGTYALLSFPVARPGSFRRAERIWINGVPGYVGPCPNENLGVVDLVVYGTDHSRDRPGYGGGHLFRELAEGIPAQVEVETGSGCLQAEVSLEEMPYARLFGSRQAFKNYSAFVNPGREPVATIFHSRGFDPMCSGATFSGCGQINPLKNDPLLESTGVGTRVLINGAAGFVIGSGTRSTREIPNLAGFADLHSMDPELMGGFMTSAGPECISSWAVPILVTSGTIHREITRLDREIGLPVKDVNTRKTLCLASYGEVWEGVDLEVEFDPRRCQGCTRCKVEEACPMDAVSFDGTRAELDLDRCFHCGLCASECTSGAFKCSLGSLSIRGRTVPVVLRQSDRLRALKMALDLKRRILDGSFKVAEPSERIA
jgi:putative methanogenesis marker 16 metalloprotein